MILVEGSETKPLAFLSDEAKFLVHSSVEVFESDLW